MPSVDGDAPFQFIRTAYQPDDWVAVLLKSYDLDEWNARCEPPWSERELTDKVRRARRYGREPIGGLLEVQP